MIAKITVLLALAMFSISTGSAQYQDTYQNYGPSNDVLARTNIVSGRQSGLNEKSYYANNRNAATNIKSKTTAENDLTAQKESSVGYQPTYVPVPAPAYAPAPAPAYAPEPTYII